jgi:hypothetical protein
MVRAQRFLLALAAMGMMLMAMAVVVATMGRILHRGQIAVGVVHRDLITASPAHDPWLVRALLVDRVGLADGTAEA